MDWDVVDQAKALAYNEWQGQFCPHCGTHNAGWVDENGRWLDEPEYEMATHKCYGCDERERLQDSLPKDLRGVYVRAQLYDPDKEPEVIQREREAKRLKNQMDTTVLEGSLF